ncbi:MAG: efflux transporter outer membrane subunit [Thermoanaerobaculia bacterium]
MKTFTANAVFSLLAISATGCITLGPDYARPPVAAPANFRGAGTGAAQTSAAASLATREWSELFRDEALRTLLAKALTDGFDVRIAAARLSQAAALAGVARADRFPAIDLEGSALRERAPLAGGAPAETSRYAVGAGLSWEIDFWGRYRRASESARDRMIAAEWGERAVVTSLIADVATRYYTLRGLDLEREIASRTQVSREESLRLTRLREDGGAASLVDVRQAEQLVFAAQGTLIDLDRRIEQQENGLSVLLGRNPGPIERGAALGDLAQIAELPEGLPSDLLERRPDIREAEALLASSTADIGVARASYFPRIALTGSGGYASGALSALFNGPAAIWSAVASAVQPLFDAGRTRSGVRYADARREEANAIYERTVRTAFSEVSDALVERRQMSALRETQQLLVDAAADSRRLADVRYSGGVTSYLEVLDSETRLFEAQLTLVQTQVDELAAYVEIYRALGGGWKQAEKEADGVL